MLVLFDIDGTLLRTQRVGTRCMREAGRRMFGEEFSLDGVEIAGRIDPLIWADMATANGIDDPAAHHDRFREIYAATLARTLARENPASAMPGVEALLAVLGAMDALTLGVLTGNYPETGRLKIKAAGLDPDQFKVAAWGSDGTTGRRDLPAVAMQRHAAATGRPVAPHEVVVIGDTPHDVDCARAHGCRSLAVATGPFSRDELAPCAPDLLLDDLTPTESIAAWVVQKAGPEGPAECGRVWT